MNSCQKTNVKLEKRIKELENLVTLTNEKRYKLQDAIVTQEKELQTTKAHVNQLTEMQTRYDNSSMGEYDIRKCSSMPQRTDPASIYKRLKMYDKLYRRKVNVVKKVPEVRNPNHVFAKYYYPRRSHTPPTYFINDVPNSQCGDFTESFIEDKYLEPPCMQFNTHSQQFMTPSTSSYINYRRQTEPLTNPPKVFKNVRKVTQINKLTETRDHLENQILEPLILEAVETMPYDVMDAGSVVWCSPSERANDVLMQQHFFANACDQIRQDINNSLHIIQAKLSNCKAQNVPRG